jgi:hypothetical protein
LQVIVLWMGGKHAEGEGIYAFMVHISIFLWKL